MIRYLAVIATLEDEVRTRVENKLSKAGLDDEGDCLLGVPARFLNAQGVEAVVWAHPVPDALAARIRARIQLLPLNVRTKLALLDAIPAGWTPVEI